MKRKKYILKLNCLEITYKGFDGYLGQQIHAYDDVN